MDLCCTGLGPMSSSCESGNEILDSIKSRILRLSTFKLLEKDLLHADSRSVRWPPLVCYANGL
jgi:hypothetical protein